APTTQDTDDKSDTGATTYGDTGVEPDEHYAGSRTTERIVGHHRNRSTQSPSSISTRSTHNTDVGTEGTAYDEEEGADGPKESSALTGLPPFREHSHSDDE
ncbi:hypothetical protein J3458_012913, partial [Metarhizium acridum]|uniref:uncharacterized protein n=1 Tax=Metarhizium acridum TaxID=92637 RepID=UPI001C6D2380